jgi:hypothetical protein
MKTWVIGAITVAVACTSGATALAQDVEGSAPTPITAPREAFEIDVNTGYTQGFGAIHARPGGAVSDVARGGIGVGFGLGYRAIPELSVSVTGQFQELGRAAEQPLGTRVRGAAIGVEGRLHTRPYERLDPWVALGTGYRMLWVAPEGTNNNVLHHGLQLARAQVGLDVRVSRDVAIGPMIGGDIDLFIWRNPEGPAGNAVLPDKELSTFVFAGVQGRFDVGGTRVERTGTIQLGKY